MSELAMRTIPGILFVIALVAVWWWTRRVQARTGGPAFKILGRSGLTRNAAIAVAEFEGRRFLIGATDQRVELLADLGHQPAVMDDESAILNLNESISGPWMDLFNRVRSEHVSSGTGPDASST